MIFRKSQIYDVAAVLEDVSDITQAEMDAGEAPVSLVRDIALDGVLRGTAFTIVDAGAPVGLFWFFPSDFETETNFISSKGFFAKPMASTKVARSVLKYARVLYPECRFVSYSTSPHPRVVRWFDLLGFDLISTAGNIKRFALRDAM